MADDPQLPTILLVVVIFHSLRPTHLVRQLTGEPLPAVYFICIDRQNQGFHISGQSEPVPRVGLACVPATYHCVLYAEMSRIPGFQVDQARFRMC